MSMDKEKIDKAVRLSVYWMLNPDLDCSDLDSVVDALVVEMEKAGERVPGRGIYRQRLMDHVRVILTNLVHAFQSYSDLYTGFYRDTNRYKNDPDSEAFQFSYRNTIKVIDFLHAQGYIEHHLGYPGSDEYDAVLAKMKATEKLIALFPTEQAEVKRDSSNVETVVLKGFRPPVPEDWWKKRRKGSHPKKKAKRRPPKPPRPILKTPNNADVRRMRQNLGIINKVIEESTIDLDLDLHELELLNRRLSSDPDQYKKPLDFTRRAMHRVFVDESLELHGRFYGGWWMGVPDEIRERIIINGMPTVELDFKAIHPHILYGIEQIEPPGKDPYIVPGMENLRPLIKKLLLIMLNSKSKWGSVTALRDAYEKDQKKAEKRNEPIPEPPFELNKENVYPVIEALQEQHDPIQHHFFKNPSNMLMYHDSEMAEEVMLHFAQDGLPCLPVHDSFILDVRAEDECWEVMRKAFNNRFDQEIPVDSPDFMKQGNRIMDGPRVVDQSPEWGDLAGSLIRDIHESW